MERHHAGLVAFVYMPEHVHLLVYPKSPDSHVEKLLYAIKKPFSDRIKLILVHNRDPLLEALTVQEHRERRCSGSGRRVLGTTGTSFLLRIVCKWPSILSQQPGARGLCQSAGPVAMVELAALLLSGWNCG